MDKTLIFIYKPIHVHRFTYTHTFTYTYMHTRTFTYTHACTHEHSHIHTHIYLSFYASKHIQIYLQSREVCRRGEKLHEVHRLQHTQQHCLQVNLITRNQLQHTHDQRTHHHHQHRHPHTQTTSIIIITIKNISMDSHMHKTCVHNLKLIQSRHRP